jgi:hypothetical protein
METKVTQANVLPRVSSAWISNNISRTAPHDHPTTQRPGPPWAQGYRITNFRSWSRQEKNATQILKFVILSKQLYMYTKAENDSLCKVGYRWNNSMNCILSGMEETLFCLAMDGNSAPDPTVPSEPNGNFPQS